ncbi:Hypothetical_protein [Hexamita inflata]|uniref:Hypothetical_protein n=1 Tax=Hexamita inflata TaxID=28002 RepID=A0AA86U989_9EUKA|nr:Hypothetical protein HINF_LOCUS36105 [Hexamita inflata]CAI9959680.1 Hypothetical protein HINF_LOCUS47325 [Hexamita inflata]
MNLNKSNKDTIPLTYTESGAFIEFQPPLQIQNKSNSDNQERIQKPVHYKRRKYRSTSYDPNLSQFESEIDKRMRNARLISDQVQAQLELNKQHAQTIEQQVIKDEITQKQFESNTQQEKLQERKQFKKELSKQRKIQNEQLQTAIQLMKQAECAYKPSEILLQLKLEKQNIEIQNSLLKPIPLKELKQNNPELYGKKKWRARNFEAEDQITFSSAETDSENVFENEKEAENEKETQKLIRRKQMLEKINEEPWYPV